jgi:putative ABC transport system permease protein
VLVKLLTGIFDPPPEALSVPWFYLAALFAVAALAVALTALVVTRSARVAVIEKLRGEP